MGRYASSFAHDRDDIVRRKPQSRHAERTRSAFIVALALALAVASLAGLDRSEEDSPTSTRTFRPTADTYVDADQPLANFGSEPRLRTDGLGVERWSYLRFDLAAVSAPIRQVALRLHANRANGAGVVVRAVADLGWDEHVVTFTTAPEMGSPLAVSAPFARDTWVQLDVTKAVRAGAPLSLALTGAAVTRPGVGDFDHGDAENDFSSRETGGDAPQLVVVTGGGAATTTTPSTTAPDSSSTVTSPTTAVAPTTTALAPTTTSPVTSGPTGQFIVQCGGPVASAPVDPIVHPGQFGSSHQHEFYGNTTISPTATYDSLVAGSTACGDKGDTASYWHPTLYIDGVRAPVPKSTFYYTGESKPGPLATWPPDLKIIAGNAAATGPQSTSVVYWGCGDGSSVSKVNMPPQCTSGDTGLTAHVIFPDCWDGLHLDSTDHKSHMAYSSAGSCPANYPVSLPYLILRLQWTGLHPAPSSVGLAVISSTGVLGIGPASTMHADWWQAWDQARLTQLVGQCINAGVDCPAA